jgi:hypothetical protein
MVKEIKYINFHNDTELPLMIDSWIDGSNVLYCRKIEAGQKLVVHSSVGEWHLHIMFPNNEDYNLWVQNEPEFTKYRSSIIGKFSSCPCASGDYSWMEYDELFQCEYSTVEHDDNNTTGLIRFYKMNT